MPTLQATLMEPSGMAKLHSTKNIVAGCRPGGAVHFATLTLSHDSRNRIPPLVSFYDITPSPLAAYHRVFTPSVGRRLRLQIHMDPVRTFSFNRNYGRLSRSQPLSSRAWNANSTPWYRNDNMNDLEGRYSLSTYSIVSLFINDSQPICYAHRAH